MAPPCAAVTEKKARRDSRLITSRAGLAGPRRKTPAYEARRRRITPSARWLLAVDVAPCFAPRIITELRISEARVRVDVRALRDDPRLDARAVDVRGTSVCEVIYFDRRARRKSRGNSEA